MLSREEQVIGFVCLTVWFLRFLLHEATGNDVSEFGDPNK